MPHHRVILDTDIGDDIDDAFALALLLRSPEVQARRHAEFERIVDEGVAYFSSEAAQELGRRRLGGER